MPCRYWPWSLAWSLHSPSQSSLTHVARNTAPGWNCCTRHSITKILQWFHSSIPQYGVVDCGRRLDSTLERINNPEKGTDQLPGRGRGGRQKTDPEESTIPEEAQNSEQLSCISRPCHEDFISPCQIKAGGSCLAQRRSKDLPFWLF